MTAGRAAAEPGLDALAGRPLLLCGHPKSGTSLLLSLLDDHPEILALPEETKYFRSIDGRSDLTSAQALLEHTRIGRLGRARSEPLAQGRDYRHVDPDRFERELTALLAVPRAPRELLPAVALAWAAALGGAPRPYWTEKTPLHEHALPRAVELWPDLRAIYLVRDPRDVHASFRAKRRRRGRELSAVRSAIRISRSLRSWRRFASRHPDRCLTVRYEELVRAPRVVMQRVAAFLGIAWNESLLRPSLAGRAWPGNSMFGESHDGISRSPLERYRRELGSRQRRLLELLLRDEFARYRWPR